MCNPPLSLPPSPPPSPHPTPTTSTYTYTNTNTGVMWAGEEYQSSIRAGCKTRGDTKWLPRTAETAAQTLWAGKGQCLSISAIKHALPMWTKSVATTSLNSTKAKTNWKCIYSRGRICSYLWRWLGLAWWCVTTHVTRGEVSSAGYALLKSLRMIFSNSRLG